MAYSSIGQAGYLLVGLAAVMIHSGAGGGAAIAAGNLGILTFLAVYVVTNIGVFAGIIALADATGRENIRDYDGFGRRSPFIAFGMALCLLSLAGIPPMAGFFSKLFILWSAWSQGSALTWLVVLGLINSAISLVYYVNVIWRMYTVEPAKRDRLSTPRTVTVTMAFSVVAILALTVAFGVLLNSLGAGASSLFTLSK
jgi:NADH-quinone oxidoreductase subunit N